MDKKETPAMRNLAKRHGFCWVSLLILVFALSISAILFGVDLFQISPEARQILRLEEPAERAALRNLIRTSDAAEATAKQLIPVMERASFQLNRTSGELQNSAETFLEDATRLSEGNNWTEQALRQGEDAARRGDFSEACFYFAYALYRRSGAADIVIRYADSLDALAREDIRLQRLGQADTNIQQLEAMINAALFSVPLDRLEELRGYLQKAGDLRLQLNSLLDEAVGEEQASETQIILEALNSGKMPSWRRVFAIANETALSDAALAEALEEREAVLQAAGLSEIHDDDGAYLSLADEVRQMRAIIVDREGEKEFQRYCLLAEDAEKRSSAEAAVLLQGAETALRNRIAAGEMLPEPRREKISSDLRDLQNRGEALAIKALEERQRDKFDALAKIYAAGLAEARSWTPPRVPNMNAWRGKELKSEGEFKGEIQTYDDRLKTGSCQEQLNQLRDLMQKIAEAGQEITAPAFRRQLDEWIRQIGERLSAVSKKQVDLYNLWAAGRISATWRYGIHFIGWVSTNKEDYHAGMIIGMAPIDTMLLSRDAALLFSTAHDSLFTHSETSSKAEHETNKKTQLYIVTQFLETPKIPLSDF